MRWTKTRKKKVPKGKGGEERGGKAPLGKISLLTRGHHMLAVRLQNKQGGTRRYEGKGGLKLSEREVALKEDRRILR